MPLLTRLTVLQIPTQLSNGKYVPPGSPPAAQGYECTIADGNYKVVLQLS